MGGGRRCSWDVPSCTLRLPFISDVAVWSKAEQQLTVGDAGQGLVEGGRVAVVGERDAHASRQEPPGQREGLLVQEEPGPEALVAHLLALQRQERRLKPGDAFPSYLLTLGGGGFRRNLRG